MSLFLGTIHHWLFRKIRLSEAMEQRILDVARDAGLPVDGFEQEAAQLFEAPLPDASLESLIDRQNIHGWLQHRIQQAESRQAFYVTRVLSYQPELKTSLLTLYQLQAEEAAAAIDDVPLTPESMVQAIHEYLLEGMPCDRNQTVLENTGRILSWQYEPCLHQDYWTAVQGDVSHYYDFREAWMHTFIKKLQPTWSFCRTSDGVHLINREGAAS